MSSHLETKLCSDASPPVSLIEEGTGLVLRVNWTRHSGSLQVTCDVEL